MRLSEFSENPPTRDQLAQLSHADLVGEICAGNGMAELSMIARFTPGLKIMLNRRCTPDIAEDVFQETWRVVIEKVRNGDVRQPDRLPAFIHQTARNQVVMYYRKNSDTQEAPDDNDLVAPGPNPEQAYETSQLQVYVRDLIANLDTPRDREILNRYFINDEDKDVICRDLNLTSQHFNRVIYRAKKRIKTYCEKNGAPIVK